MEDALSKLLESHSIRPQSVPSTALPSGPHLPPRTRAEREFTRRDGGGDTEVRPHAPIKGPSKSSAVKGVGGGRRGSARNGDRNADASRKVGGGTTRTLSDNWKGLDYFDRTSLSRRIGGGAGGGGGELESENDVHFVNAPSGETGGMAFRVNDVVSGPKNKNVVLPSTMFNIPTLPSGHRLTLNILSTWGDPYYVGLMGLELFDEFGCPLPLPVVSADGRPALWADPPDINVLPAYDSDPRVIETLVDGVNDPCDDLYVERHMTRALGGACATRSELWGARAPHEPRRHQCERALGGACEGF
jgi:hypothetical protein